MLCRLARWISNLIRRAGCDEDDWDPYWDYGDWRTDDQRETSMGKRKDRWRSYLDDEDRRDLLSSEGRARDLLKEIGPLTSELTRCRVRIASIKWRAEQRQREAERASVANRVTTP